MAFQCLMRSNRLCKLRHAQLHSIRPSCGARPSTLHSECDETILQVPEATVHSSTGTPIQGYCRKNVNSSTFDFFGLKNLQVSIRFSKEQNHEHNQEGGTPNSKSPILPAALYLGAVLLGTSTAFCDAENKDDVESEPFVNCPASSEFAFPHPQHCCVKSCNSSSPKKSYHCQTTSCSNASSDASIASCCAHQKVFSHSASKKLNNHEKFDPFLSHGPDYEGQDLEANSGLASSTVLQQNPAVHLDGKSDGDSSYKQKLQNAISRSTAILKSKLIMCGAVGASVAVMLDGELVWSQGLGYCNVESGTACSCYSKYRIASISKSITATIAMALWEDGLLDLDAPITKYLPDWPKKTVNGKEVNITTHHLLTHSSGIRHYCLKKPDTETTQNSGDSSGVKTSQSPDTEKPTKSVSPSMPVERKSGQKSNLSQDNKREDFKKYVESRREALTPQLNYYKILDEKAKRKREEDDSGDLWEYYINKPYSSVEEAVELFKDDDLFFTPGSSFLYTSHGYVLLSRVLEAASGTPFSQLAEDFFQNVGLGQTQLDTERAVVPRRVPCYERDERHELRPAPHVNNSYKWAGGGFLSSAVDLVRLGAVLLYSLHATDHMIKEHNVQPGFLKASTVQKMWSPYFYHKTSKAFTRNFLRGYGLGWCVQVPRMDQYDKNDSISQIASVPKNSTAGSEVEDDSFVRISTPWEPSKRSKARVPPESKAADDSVVEQGSDLSAEPEESQDLKQLPGVKPLVQNVSKSTNGIKLPLDIKPAEVLPEAELEKSDWVEGDPIGSRNCRGCCLCGGFAAYHTGAAVGGSSILLIMPQPPGEWLVQRHQAGDADKSDNCSCGGKISEVKAPQVKTPEKESLSSDTEKKKDEKVQYRSIMAPRSSWNGCRLCERKCDGEIDSTSKQKYQAEVQGVVVAILTNYTGVNFADEAFKIAKEFSAVAS